MNTNHNKMKIKVKDFSKPFEKDLFEKKRQGKKQFTPTEIMSLLRYHLNKALGEDPELNQYGVNKEENDGNIQEEENQS